MSQFFLILILMQRMHDMGLKNALDIAGNQGFNNTKVKKQWHKQCFR